MKHIAANLFNFLDDKSKGAISFEDLFYKVFPSMTKDNYEVIMDWIKSYRSNVSSVQTVDRNKASFKYKQVPPEGIKKLRSLFRMVDEGGKGYVTVDDLKKVFRYGSTPKEVEDIFNACDKDKDQKLKFVEFVDVILPPSFRIDPALLVDEVTSQGDQNRNRTILSLIFFILSFQYCQYQTNILHVSLLISLSTQ
eukprot:TRINITY_DN3885_c0_g1_i4.p1 TRINITY_DN3885_c0_g1~~TRINITY_DN3885_c0_g1_i4.p1  ORF type:complete len:195 (-),score=12.05 TRINITY_DN3885_c0_g1_i4:159-743(-)